ncbi:MAG: endonuclease/exonuclease/phosphatase family protein [Rikenellaceae bacterium]
MRAIKIIISVTILPLLLVAFLLLSEWRPQDVEREVYAVEIVDLPDTLTLVSWNIGYAGLGEGMDFFYDGGERTRGPREEGAENLRAIIAQLSDLSYADFILLQEVDFDSKRSYYVDQYEVITEALDYNYSAKAYNYNSVFVPIPLCDPMGGVRSGVVTLSRYPLAESVRWQYPTIVGLPNRLFDLKRCMLSAAVATPNGNFWVNNTHNTAFDSGDMRLREVAFMGEIVESQGSFVVAGDWNSTPPGYTPSREAMENRYFSPHPLDIDELPQGVSVHFTPTVESVRYLDSPYEEGESVTTIVDFTILSSNCRIIRCETLDLKFENSDHNPIIITFLRE